jgi:hypothetical protein
MRNQAFLIAATAQNEGEVDVLAMGRQAGKGGAVMDQLEAGLFSCAGRG